MGAFFLSNQCPYAYGYTELETKTQSEASAAEKRVNDTFGTQNVLAVVVPAGDYDREGRLLDALSDLPQVDYAQGLANVEVKDGYVLTDN